MVENIPMRCTATKEEISCKVGWVMISCMEEMVATLSEEKLEMTP